MSSRGEPFGDDLALVHDDEPVAELLRLVHVVRRQEERHALALEPVQAVPDHVAGLRIEAGRRLVEEHDLGLVDERARDRQPALHAARERLDPVVRALGELDELEQLVGPRASSSFAREPEVAAVDDDVLADRQLQVERVLLGHDAEPAADLHAVVAGSSPNTRERPVRHRRDAPDHAHRRRLPRAVRPEEPEGLPALEVEVDRVDGGEIAEALDEPACLDERLTVARATNRKLDERRRGGGACSSDRTSRLRVASTSRAICSTSSASDSKTASSRSRAQSSSRSRSAVEVALEVEEVRLDAPLGAAVVRVRADGDRRPVAERRSRVDPEARHREKRVDGEIRGRIPERPAALVAGDDRPVELERPAEHLGGRDDVASASAERIAVDETPRPPAAMRTSKPSRSSSSRSPERLYAEAEVLPGDDDLGADRSAGSRSANCSGLSCWSSGVNAGHDRRLDTGFLQQLEAALERRQEVDPVPEGDPRMRVERDHRRGEPRRLRRADDGSVPPVHAVERADRRPPAACARPRAERDATFTPRASRAPRSGGMIVSGSASSTENGPISVRRSVRQCPPSASAIERT